MTAKPAKRPATLPARFEPKFRVNADQRQCIVKEIRRRHEVLAVDAGVDSYQKQLLAERAIFISIQLETMEVTASQGGEFAPGVYAQMTNSLVGLLRVLGIERRAKESPWIEAAREVDE